MNRSFAQLIGLADSTPHTSDLSFTYHYRYNDAADVTPCGEWHSVAGTRGKPRRVRRLQRISQSAGAPKRGIQLPASDRYPPSLSVVFALERSLRIVAGSARRPALFPQLFPIPDPVCHFVRQRESELMSEHTHLPAMMGFVRKHVAQHFRAHRPRRSPAVSAKLLDAAVTTAERFSEHLCAASGTLGQSRTGLARRAMRAVELLWNLQVRSCKPDPLGADIVHVREDRRNGTGLARRFGSPGGRVKMFDKDLVHVIIGGKDLDCGSAELSVNLILTHGHGSLLLDL